MEWIHEYLPIATVLVPQVIYIIIREAKRTIKDEVLREEFRVLRSQAQCPVHALRLQHIEERLNNIERKYK